MGKDKKTKNNENKPIDGEQQTLYGADEQVMFVPMELIRDFEQIFEGLKQTQQEFVKVGKAMKPISQDELSDS